MPPLVDGVIELEANDPRLEGNNAWREHPQAGFGIRYYTAAGAPVLMRAVPHLPTQEIMGSLLLPLPGEVSFAQLMFKLIKSGNPEYRMREVIFSRPEDWDYIFILISALISSMASTLLGSFNLVGIDLSAILLKNPDKTQSLEELCTSDEFVAVAKNTEAAQCAGFFLRLRALLA